MLTLNVLKPSFKIKLKLYLSSNLIGRAKFWTKSATYI